MLAFRKYTANILFTSILCVPLFSKSIEANILQMCPKYFGQKGLKKYLEANSLKFHCTNANLPFQILISVNCITHKQFGIPYHELFLKRCSLSEMTLAKECLNILYFSVNESPNLFIYPWNWESNYSGFFFQNCLQVSAICSIKWQYSSLGLMGYSKKKNRSGALTLSDALHSYKLHFFNAP